MHLRLLSAFSALFARRPTGGRRARLRGYTAVEVLMAMTVATIGAAAVMSMQKASVQGNLEARKADIANSVARAWVERLQTDAMQWTLPNDANSNSNFQNALFLNGHVSTGPGTWFLPTDEMTGGSPETMSPGFDILGRDLTKTDLANAVFCANVRLTWLYQSTTSPQNNLIRADVRVLWARGISNAPPAGGLCTATVAALAAPDPLTYHAIYTTTAIRQNGLQ